MKRRQAGPNMLVLLIILIVVVIICGTGWIIFAHRAAAAKLRGEKSIIIDSITLTSAPWECELS